MDYRQMTAPCGLDCFNCIGYLANHDPKLFPVIAEALDISLEQAKGAACQGCRKQHGKIPLLPMQCNVYPCVEDKGISFCHECVDFPCDHLHPYADRAAILPHNTKVFNLCLIRKLGLQTWAETKAKDVKDTYFNAPWRL
jgi:hypothetical protein